MDVIVSSYNIALAHVCFLVLKQVVTQNWNKNDNNKNLNNNNMFQNRKRKKNMWNQVTF